MKKIEALKELNEILKSGIGKKKYKYYIPSLWLDVNSGCKNINVDPFEFYSRKIDEILKTDERIKNKKSDLNGNWSSKAAVYNIFVRLTSAYDHNNNGKIDLPQNDNGWSETGTFLKTIALLPYFKYLGLNTLHLLPITSIGHDGNKGRLGSPYAIKNPYEIDPNLAEKNINLGTNLQFLAFVEAAKRMGFRIILEFVFRTSAKDGDWVHEHPEWYYWIKEDIELRDPKELDENKYGSPVFTSQELHKIHSLVNEKKMDMLPEPHIIYKEMFTPIPEKVDLSDGKYIGVTKNGVRTKIPGAFADWPPDDNQPPWSDVTYLRMYDDMKFNYIAYNTIRMYDTRYANSKNINKPLWDKIINIIPSYQDKYGVDGVMIDMGHALPPDLLKKIQKKARQLNPYFAFWEENFSLSQRSVEQGYNVTLGYMWSDEHYPDRLKNLFYKLSTEGMPLPFFASPETHNTPRAITRNEGLKYSLFALYLNAFLPAIFFIHSGYELCVDYPVNTGLDFSNEEQKKYPSEELPLFSESSFNWNNKQRFIRELANVSKARAKYINLISDNNPASLRILETESEEVFGYIRSKGKQKIYVVANSNFTKTVKTSLYLNEKTVVDIFIGKKLSARRCELLLTFKPGEVKVFLSV